MQVKSISLVVWIDHTISNWFSYYMLYPPVCLQVRTTSRSKYCTKLVSMGYCCRINNVANVKYLNYLLFFWFLTLENQNGVLHCHFFFNLTNCKFVYLVKHHCGLREVIISNQTSKITKSSSPEGEMRILFLSSGYNFVLKPNKMCCAPYLYMLSRSLVAC